MTNTIIVREAVIIGDPYNTKKKIKIDEIKEGTYECICEMQEINGAQVVASMLMLHDEIDKWDIKKASFYHSPIVVSSGICGIFNERHFSLRNRLDWQVRINNAAMTENKNSSFVVEAEREWFKKRLLTFLEFIKILHQHEPSVLYKKLVKERFLHIEGYDQESLKIIDKKIDAFFAENNIYPIETKTNIETITKRIECEVKLNSAYQHFKNLIEHDRLLHQYDAEAQAVVPNAKSGTVDQQAFVCLAGEHPEKESYYNVKIHRDENAQINGIFISFKQ